MATIQDQVKLRFVQLVEQANKIPLHRGTNINTADQTFFYAWASSALNLVQGVFGKDSPHYERLHVEIDRISNNFIEETHLNACRGLFLGAKSDVDGGYLFNIQMSFSGEIFSDVVSAAKARFDNAKGTHRDKAKRTHPCLVVVGPMGSVGKPEAFPHCGRKPHCVRTSTAAARSTGLWSSFLLMSWDCCTGISRPRIAQPRRSLTTLSSSVWSRPAASIHRIRIQ